MLHDAKPVLRELFEYTMAKLDLGPAMDSRRPLIDRVFEHRTGPPKAWLRMIMFGKAAIPMGEWFHENYELDSVEGVLCAPELPRRRWPGVHTFLGGHPTPNSDSVRAATEALRIARAAREQQVVVFLISGGGSALLEAPLRPTVSLSDLQSLNRTLVSSGADIVEMNVVRKHLSAVKGGRLAEAAYPAQQLTLYVSDVPEGQDSSVASGPTMPDDSTLADLGPILTKYDLDRKLPPAVTSLLNDPALPETPKPGDACFGGSEWICVLENRHAIDAAKRFAERKDWQSVVDTSVDDTDVGVAAVHLLDRLHRLSAAKSDRPVCVISGGELSSPVRGQGIGGRNQAFVLECIKRIAGERIAILSAGTDGIDGNLTAAGAVADGNTFQRAQSLHVDPDDYRERSDSYTFFKRLGDDITCGATQNNVRDIRVLVSWP